MKEIIQIIHKYKIDILLILIFIVLVVIGKFIRCMEESIKEVSGILFEINENLNTLK